MCWPRATQRMGFRARIPSPPSVWSPRPWIRIPVGPSEVRCLPSVSSKKQGYNHSSYHSGVSDFLWTELYSEASKKCARPTRAATRLASETGLAKCPEGPGDTRPLRSLSRKQAPRRTVCFKTCGWSRPGSFPRAGGWRDLAFGVWVLTSGLEMCPRWRVEVKSSPTAAPPGHRAIGEGGLGQAAWPLQPDSLRIQSDPAVLTSSPWRGGSQPHRVPHGKGCEAAPFFCP